MSIFAGQAFSMRSFPFGILTLGYAASGAAALAVFSAGATGAFALFVFWIGGAAAVLGSAALRAYGPDARTLEREIDAVADRPALPLGLDLERTEDEIWLWDADLEAELRDAEARQDAARRTA